MNVIDEFQKRLSRGNILIWLGLSLQHTTGKRGLNNAFCDLGLSERDLCLCPVHPCCGNSQIQFAYGLERLESRIDLMGLVRLSQFSPGLAEFRPVHLTVKEDQLLTFLKRISDINGDTLNAGGNFSGKNGLDLRHQQGPDIGLIIPVRLCRQKRKGIGAEESYDGDGQECFR